MLGIFGGTFDPIHYGHLRPVLEVQQSLGLEQIRFLPLAVAVHRAQPMATAAQRLAMVQAAITGQPGFVVDDREIGRNGPSYTLDSLVAIRHDYPQARLCLLIGHDAFQGFLTWHRPLEILKLAHLVVMQRPGAKPAKNLHLARLLKARLCPNPDTLRNFETGRIVLQSVTQLDISSSAIRANIATGKDVRFLLPDRVLEQIYSKGLYKHVIT